MEKIIEYILKSVFFAWIVISLVAIYWIMKNPLDKSINIYRYDLQYLMSKKNRFIRKVIIWGAIIFLIICLSNGVFWLISIVFGEIHWFNNNNQILISVAIALCYATLAYVHGHFNQTKNLIIDNELFYNLNIFYYDTSIETIDKNIEIYNVKAEELYKKLESKKGNFIFSQVKDIRKLEIYHSLLTKLHEIKDNRISGAWKK